MGNTESDNQRISTWSNKEREHFEAGYNFGQQRTTELFQGPIPTSTLSDKGRELLIRDAVNAGENRAYVEGIELTEEQTIALRLGARLGAEMLLKKETGGAE